MVRRKFLFHQKSKVDINWKEKNKKNKHAGMFEEVIDTSKLKITVSKHMFLRKQQLKTSKWYAELLLTCWWYANFFWIIWWYAVEKRLGTTGLEEWIILGYAFL